MSLARLRVNNSLVNGELELRSTGPYMNRFALKVSGEYGAKALLITPAGELSRKRGIVNGTETRTVAVCGHGPFAEILKTRGTSKRRFYGLLPALAVITHPKHYVGFSK